MGSRIAIRVLGDFSVTRDGSEAPLPQSRKTRALLAYLAVVNKPQRRERLCELFWDVPDDPRGALRWSLSKLRPIVNADGVERLDADRNYVQLKSSGLELDYDLVRGLSADSIGELATERLESIAAAFTGPFLADLSLPRCSAFEAWRAYCANDAEVVRLKTLRTLLDRLANEPERALAHIHALQSLLPEEDFGKEIARINEQARLTVAVKAERTAAQVAPLAVLAPAVVVAAQARAVPDVVSEVAPVLPNSPGQQIRLTTARDGVRIAYGMSGSGPPIVRASHWMSHLEFDWESPVWGHWIDSLSDGFTLFRYDGRLNGLSDTECDDLSLNAFVSDLEAVVDAAGLEKFVLLGISQGAALSIEYASRHPDRVAGLLLYGGYVRGWRSRGNPTEIARREAIGTLMRQGWGQDDPVFRQLFTNLFIPGANRAQMDWFNELQKRTLTPNNAWRLSNSFSTIDVSARLGGLKKPTAVWHARSDRVAPFAGGVEFAEKIPGARFTELDSSNHILLGDEPAFQVFMRGAKNFAHQVLRTPIVMPVDQRTLRLATILCADFSSPLQSLAEESPETAIEIVDRLAARAAEIVKANGGTVLSITDAELMASFGAPEALEGHAALACRAALAIRDICAEEPAHLIVARIALDTGVVIVGPARVGSRGGIEVRGAPVINAGTIARALRVGRITATERTRQSAGGFAAMQALAPDATSGMLGDQRLYQVNAIRRALSRWHLRAERQLSPFIGRDMQLQLLNRAWHEARDGEGQTVFVFGDPGVGKSRVTHEFVGAIPDDEAECLEAGALETDLGTGLLVIRRLLQGLFGIDDADGAAVATEKVLMAHTGRGLDERLIDPVLAAMDLPVRDPLWAAISAPERARRIREGVVAQLLSLAAFRPIVLLVEDLHWIDTESAVILARLAEALQAGRLLMIVTCRPEYDRSIFSGAGPVEIRLSAFSSAETEELLDHLLGSAPELSDLRARLTGMCKGNALFLEETVRALADTGKLKGQPGHYHSEGQIGEIAVSATLHSIVDARFERLDADAKRLAEVASIFDGEIPASLLRRLDVLAGDHFDMALQTLKRADLLVEVQVFPEPMLRFKHVLIRNAISGRILNSARIELHRVALAELKVYYADRIDENVERLARHALEAQSWEDAVTYLLACAWKAIRRSAHTIALSDLDTGIRLLRDHCEMNDAQRREIEFHLARGVALMAARGWGSEEVLAAFQSAEALCEATGDETRLFSTLRGRAQYYMISGKPAAAQELAERCAKLTQDSDDPGLHIETNHMFWTNNFFLGDVAAARKHAESAIGCYEVERDHRLAYVYSGHDPGVCSRCFAGLSAWLEGDPAGAHRYCRDAVELAERLQQPLSTALAYWGFSYLHVFAGEPEDALRWAERELSTAERFQFPLLSGQALCQLGWARFQLGERDNGLRQMEEGVAAIRGTGAEMGLPYVIALYAESLAESGRLDDAQSSIVTAIDLGRQNGTRFQLAEVLSIEARIREELGASTVEVETRLRRAADVAFSQHSRIGELRIATELARRLRDRGREYEASDLISRHAALIAQLRDSPHALAAREFLREFQGP
ncbi:alpha/beta fold hydrolase [Pseudaminobacter sp. 19-2017]|uniref:Alpha/beta fold hydrolase n=1 Tax=Pseudaminobacter soli (ex Zhang et al. 2022) TaxID=2831468 RepID=A0A942DVS3_9HYPH|nr:alpha/beta fold hydrolase [Pseudaminobacter soli]MBS3647302.1 alpha/beta fold hydrolase [Pseudaminobacter soli]